jgi:hypothetical protein
LAAGLFAGAGVVPAGQEPFTVTVTFELLLLLALPLEDPPELVLLLELALPDEDVWLLELLLDIRLLLIHTTFELLVLFSVFVEPGPVLLMSADARPPDKARNKLALAAILDNLPIALPLLVHLTALNLTL